MPAFALLLLGISLGAYAPQRMATDMLPKEQEAKVQAIAKNLRCAVCQGVSVADSPASMARAQLDKVRELVAQGKTEEEIQEYFVARYGEWVLMTPTTQGVNLAVWLAPVVVLVAGFFLIVRRAQKTKGPLSAVPGGRHTSEDEYLKQVRAELEK